MSVTPFEAARQRDSVATACAELLQIARALRDGATQAEPQETMMAASRRLEGSANILIRAFGVGDQVYARIVGDTEGGNT